MDGVSSLLISGGQGLLLCNFLHTSESTEGLGGPKGARLTNWNQQSLLA